MKVHIIGPDFVNLLLNFRILWLAGRFGGGKTALASLLAAWLWWRGYVDDTVANYPLAFANPSPRPPLRNYCVVVDEAWQFARDSQALQRYGAFLRKLNNFLLLPSVFPLTPRLSTFWVERVFNAYVLGLPAWVWRWNLTRPSYREKGYFVVIAPHRVFELYDTYAVVGDDGKIADLLAATFPKREEKDKPQEKPSKTKEKKTPTPAPAAQQLAMPIPPETASDLADTASVMLEAVDVLTDRLQKIARVRR